MAGLTVKYYTAADRRGEAVDKIDYADPAVWDRLRESDAFFRIEKERDGWLSDIRRRTGKEGSDRHLEAKALNIIGILKKNGFSRIFSAGSGNAGLEYFIKTRYPEAHLTVSDFSPRNAALLRHVFTECDEVETFDMLTGPWGTLGGDSSLCVLMYRVDTAFTNDKWREVFKRAADADVRAIIFIPHQFLTLRTLLARALYYAYSVAVRKKKLVFVGTYCRTKTAFRELFDTRYSLEEIAVSGGLSGNRGFLARKTA